MIGASQAWKQTFNYDRYGNRNFDSANTTTISNCPTSQCNPTINSSNNRFNSGQGYSYDSSGNVISDAEGRTFIYDGENKQKEVKNSSNQVIGTYYYDGDGKRIKKVTASETIVFVYDAGGKLLEEYSTAAPQTAEIRYLTNDHLGSPSIITDGSGSVTSRRDFMPFGEEATAGIGNRAIGHSYTSNGDSTKQKFTGYERDDETNLDFAQARMHNFSHGRFTSPDPLFSTGKVVDARSWNRYIYALNNPLIFTDPAGLYVFDKSVTQEQRKRFNAALETARKNLSKIEKIYGKDSKEYLKANRAVNSYGKLGQKNGVIVFTKNGIGGARTSVEGRSRRKTKENPTGQNVRVMFDSDAFDLVSLIAHEGSHVADGTDWVKSGFRMSANPTMYQTESDAYLVSSLMAEANGVLSSYLIFEQDKKARANPRTRFLGATLYNSGWKEADKAKLRQENIDFYLSVDKKYKLTPKDTKKAFRRNRRRR